MTPLRPTIIKGAHAVWARGVHEPTSLELPPHSEAFIIERSGHRRAI